MNWYKEWLYHQWWSKEYIISIALIGVAVYYLYHRFKRK